MIKRIDKVDWVVQTLSWTATGFWILSIFALLSGRKYDISLIFSGYYLIGMICSFVGGAKDIKDLEDVFLLWLAAFLMPLVMLFSGPFIVVGLMKTHKKTLIFISGGLLAVSLRFVPDLIYRDYDKGYLHLSDADRFDLAVDKLLTCDNSAEATHALAQVRVLANDGYAPAQFWIGSIYEEGRQWHVAPNGECAKNMTEAIIWYKASARQGYKYALEALARIQNIESKHKQIQDGRISSEWLKDPENQKKFSAALNEALQKGSQNSQ